MFISKLTDVFVASINFLCNMNGGHEVCGLFFASTLRDVQKTYLEVEGMATTMCVHLLQFFFSTPSNMNGIDEANLSNRMLSTS